MFPTPIGGTSLPSELAACIVFIVLYALLVPVMLYRAWDRRSRTILLLGTCISVVDRIVLFSLRAVATRRPELRLSDGLLKYGQVSFGLGFVAIGGDLVSLLRCVLINPTYGYGESGRYDESPASRTKDGCFEPPKEGDEDNPTQRGKLRGYISLLSVSFLSSTIPGIVSLGWFAKGNFANEDKANRLFTLRYASTTVGLFLIFVAMLFAAWSRRKQPRVCHKAIKATFSIAALTVIVAVYRLIVMRYRVPSLEYTGPGSLNSPGAKACFYIFHMLPEWLAVSILLCFNTRKLFGTGFWGDYRGKDDSEKAIQRRKARKAKRDAKKAVSLQPTIDPEKGGSTEPKNGAITSVDLVGES